MKQLRLIVMALVALLASARVGTPAQPATRDVDPKADEVLKQMGETLKAAKSFSFSAHAFVDQLLPDGQKIQYAKNQKVTLRRPDKLAADVAADIEDLQFRYDGKQVFLFNPRTSSYGCADVPSTT